MAKRPTKSKNRNATASFRLVGAVSEAGKRVEFFRENLSFFARAALANFTHAGKRPISTRELAAQLDTKTGEQCLIRLTDEEKSNYKKYAKAYKLPLSSLIVSAFSHALNVRQF